jgi:zinc transporter ZupT
MLRPRLLLLLEASSLPDILVSSILAGLATVLGGVIVLFLGRPSDRVLGLFLGLASGVMLAVVAVDLLPAACPLPVVLPWACCSSRQ